MNRFLPLITCLALVGIATAQPEQAEDVLVPASRAGGPGPLLGPFPTAGTILGTFPTPFTSATGIPNGVFSMEYDIVNNRMWFGDQIATPPAPGTTNIVGLDPVTRAVVQSFSFVNVTCTGGAPGYIGPANGLTVTRGGTSMVLDDFNGDLATLDDNAAEFDMGTGAITNAWRLDSLSCPTTCAPNTNTNTPQVSIGPVREATNIDSSTADPGAAQTFLFSASGTANIAVAELSPGCPGGWFRRAVFTVPGATSPAGLDWDHLLQSLWVINRLSAATNLIFECKYNRGTNTLAVVQSWLAPGGLFSIALGAKSDHDAVPHEVWVAAAGANTMIRYDGGHAPGFIVPSPGPPGSGSAILTITEDPQNDTRAYVAAASLAPAPVGIGMGDDRSVFLNVDGLLLLTLLIPSAPPVYTGFQGAVVAPGPPTPANPPVATITINGGAPLSGLALAIGHVILDLSGNSVTGFSGYSPPFTITLP